MALATRQVDHLVYCVHDLETTIEHFTDAYGITPVIGGRHLHKGTRNGIISLGNDSYLEILAIDKDNKNVTGNRWMGIDHLQQPKMTRWAMKSDDIRSDLTAIKNIRPDLCQIDIGQRITPSGQVLKWNMSVPLPDPEVEIIPFFLDWSDSEAYPSQGLEQLCTLKKIEITHPQPKEIQLMYKELGLELKITESSEASIMVTFEGPKGKLIL